jgi:hypothetical protein
MDRLRRGWALTVTSWNALMGDPGLAVFTVLAALCTIVAAIPFVLPVLIAAGGKDQTRGGLSIVLLLIFYFVVSFITMFFNTALVGAALDRLRGGNAGVRAGLQIALQNLPSIAGFAIISASVGVILAVIEERFELVGEIIASIVGAAWSVATFLVLPVIVVEREGPFAAIRTSTSMLRRTWGEQIVGTGSIGLIFFLAGLLGVIPIVLGLVSHVTALTVAGVAFAALYWAALFLLGSALGQIFRAAVYLYAQNGVVPVGFDAPLLREAFTQKAKPA